jgi:hypothetical protein
MYNVFNKELHCFLLKSADARQEIFYVFYAAPELKPTNTKYL